MINRDIDEDKNDSFDHEKEVSRIRQICNETDKNVSQYSIEEEPDLYIRYLDSKGRIRMIVLYPKELEFPNLNSPDDYKVYYFYDVSSEIEDLIFVNVINEKTQEYYRFYFKDGEIFRYRASDDSIYDFTNGENDIILPSDVISLSKHGIQEIVYAHGG